MIDSRLNPNTTSASFHVPLSSGPRWRAQRRASATGPARRSASAPEVNSPSSPHTVTEYAERVGHHGAPHPAGEYGVCSATLPTGRRRCTATCDDGSPRATGRRAGGGGGGREFVVRVEGARAVGRAQRGRHRFGPAAKLAALAAVTIPLTTGCSVDEALRFGWPVGVTPQATAMREFWTWSAVAALVVGVITWGAMFWAMIFHRKRAGDSDVPPRQTQYNLPVEIVFTIVPTIIVAVLFAFTVQVQNNVMGQDPAADLKVNITAFQWN